MHSRHFVWNQEKNYRMGLRQHIRYIPLQKMKQFQELALLTSLSQ